MRFLIDVFFIDSKNRVVDLFENLEPISLNPKTWRIYKPSKPVKHVLELMAGTIKNKKILEGDFLTFLKST